MQILTLDTVSTLTIEPNATYLYPTDSLYGLGCVVSPANIQKIHDAKHRQGGKHYSLIAPSFEWINKHFVVDDTIQTKRHEWFALYGPLTLLCQRKDPTFYAYISSNDSIGIRIINHPFQSVVAGMGQPFISTSANISGTPYNPEGLSSLFASSIDYHILSDAPMTNRPSTLIDWKTQSILHR